MADPSDLNRPYNSSVQVTSAWLNAVSDRLLNPTKTDWRQWSDADLDTSPGSLSDRFAKYADQLRVTANVGRVVSISPGYVGLSDGSILEIGTVATSTPASLTIPDNTTLKVYVAPSGVAYGPTLPVGSLYLADVTTAGGYVMNIADRRSLVSLMASANGALEDRLDALAAALGSVETSVDFSTANDGDIIRVGSDGGLVASDPFTAIGINASFLDGIDANLNPNGASGKSVILGTDNSLIFGDAPANSLGEYTLNVPVWNTHETLVRSPSGDIRAAGGLRLEYGSGPTNFVYGDRRYAFDVAGTTHSAVFPRPTRCGEFIEITNLGTTSALTLDFRTNAVGTSVGNGLLGTGASEVFIATGTNNTSDWWTFAQPSTIGSAATGAGGGGSSGSATGFESWATIQSQWLQVSASVTGGAGRTLVNLSTKIAVSTLPQGRFIVLDANTLLSATTTAITKIPINGGAVTTTSVSGGFVRGCPRLMPDGRVIVALSTGIAIYNPVNNSVTSIPLGGGPTVITAVEGAFGDDILVTNDGILWRFSLTSQTWIQIGDFRSGSANFLGRLNTNNRLLGVKNNGNVITSYNITTKSFEADITVAGFTNIWLQGVTQSGRMLFQGSPTGGGTNYYTANSTFTEFSGSLGTVVNTGNPPVPLPDGRIMLSSGSPAATVFVSASGLTAVTSESSILVNGELAVMNKAFPDTGNPIAGGNQGTNGTDQSKFLQMAYSAPCPLSVYLSPFYNFV